MRKAFQISFFFCFLMILSCNQVPEKKLFELLSADHTGIDFSNTIENSDSLITLSFEYLFNGGGVAVGDFNNDGKSDLFFTGNMSLSQLYLNKGKMQFENITASSGINTKNKWSSGATAVDINQDGWLDIYISVGGLSTDKEKRANLLYINQKDNTFIESASEYGLADSGYSINAAFFDYDKDGDLDLYLLTTELDPYNWNEFRPRRSEGQAPNTDKLYRNNGDLTFTDVSQEAGIKYEGYGLGLGLCDFNEDGWMDMYVANDFLSNDVIYINNTDGTFSDKVEDYFSHSSRNSMGTDLQDFNNDGYTDLMVLDMLPTSNVRQKSMFGFFNYDKFQLGIKEGYLPQYARNTLQLNNGNGTFSEVGQLAGVDKTDWSWCTLFADFDNDGWQDLFITNGYRQDITNMDFATYSRQLTSSPIGTQEAKEVKMFNRLKELPEIKTHNYIYKNSGEFPFDDKSKEWGFDIPTYSNGAAYADLDNDGDLDLVINNIDEKAFVYQNNLYQAESKDSSNYLRVSLIGEKGNSHAVGAKVEIFYQDKTQVRLVSPYRGYLSTVENVLHFGLGTSESVDLRITWQNGRVQERKNVKSNQQLQLIYKKEYSIAISKDSYDVSPIFKEVSKELNLNLIHQENDLIDFKLQPILPHKHSQSAPSLAVADVNGDGLDDLFMGGSAGFNASLFLQTAKGNFTPSSFPFDAELHDMGSLFFDADNDGDKDLYVVSGGVDLGNNNSGYQDRFYVNDGQGSFSETKTSLPKINSSGCSVTAADYDNDGDLDLLVSGRVVPGNYPESAKTLLLRNDSNDTNIQFSDQSKLLPNDGLLGMSSQALWTDFDNDQKIDLLVVGEWSSITFLKNNDGNFKTKAELPNSSGWWNAVTGGDFDNDGDIDYVVGNLGLNSKYHASEKEPVQLFAKDFDKNGRIDPILSYYLQGENYIAASRDMLIAQINSMRVRFKTYESYGKSTFDKSFTKDELSDAQRFEAVNFASSYIENLGNGDFNIKPLPMEAQVAPIFGMQAQDVNNDGYLDLMMVGNSYAAEIMVGQYDACKGLVLLGNGEGDFEPQSINDSGFFVDQDAKALVQIYGANGQPIYVASRNRNSLKVFQFNSTFDNRAINFNDDDRFATIENFDGSFRKIEHYNGAGFLSQSSNKFPVSSQVKSVSITNSNGETRNIDLSN